MNKMESLSVSRRRLEQACARRPDDKESTTQLLQVLEELDAYTDLQQRLADAMARWPRNTSLLMIHARIQTYLGNFPGAATAYQAILQYEPGHVGALCSMVMQGHGEDVGGIVRVEARLAAQGLTNAERIALGYARARLLEQSRQFDEAFATLQQANAHRAAIGGMDLAAKQRGARTVVRDINAAIVERCGGRGNDSDRPIFIVGMPRSGTTLTEQILTSHPDIHGAGERLFWGEILSGLIRSAPRDAGSMIEAIDALHAQVWADAGDNYLRSIGEKSADSLRVTDKLPANFALLPFIRLIFPRARIIHIRRHPLATIASCIRAPFSDPSLAFTVEGWARFYGVYHALMDCWRPLLANQLLEVDYEALVSDLPAQARRLIDFLGLDWDDACLHPELNQRAVRTASTQQVRREVHAGSIDAWRCYERQLEAIRPCIKESRALVLSPGVSDE
jgi:hypothetical protein